MNTDASPSTTLAAWKKSDEHEITLPSGSKVKIRPLDLEMHMLLGETPGGLRQKALQELTRKIEGGQASDAERTEADQMAVSYHRALICQMVIAPKLVEDDLSDIPERDVKMLLEIALRSRSTDAAGAAIGVVPLEGSPGWGGS